MAKKKGDTASVPAAEALAGRGDQSTTAPPVERKRGRPEVELTVEVGRRIVGAVANGNFPTVDPN